MKKKFFSILLSLAMVITMMPTMTMTAFAAVDSTSALVVKNLSNQNMTLILNSLFATDVRELTYQQEDDSWPISCGVNEKMEFTLQPGKTIAFDEVCLWDNLITNQPWFTCDQNYSVSGNLEFFLPSQCNVMNSAFDSHLVDASGLTFPNDLDMRTFNKFFDGCTNLVSGPSLPATTLTQGCYMNMFSGCSKLSSLTVGFNSFGEGGYTSNWLYNVAQSGTIYVNESLLQETKSESFVRSANTVPSGWTIIGPKENQQAPNQGVGYTLDYAAETMVASADYEISSTNGDTATALTDNKVTPGNTYYVRLKETDTLNASPWTANAIPERPAKAGTPVLASKTETSITVTTVAGQEYSIDNGTTWVNDGGDGDGDGTIGTITFSGLTKDVTYSIITRTKAVTSGSMQFAGVNSDALTVKAEEAKSKWSLLAGAFAGEGEYSSDTEIKDGETPLFKVKDETEGGVITRTITLLSNITATSDDSGFEVKSSSDGGKEIVLDLNGHVLDRGLIADTGIGTANEKSSVIEVNDESNLTIKDSNTGKNAYKFNVLESGLWKYAGDWKTEDKESESVKKVSGGVITGGYDACGGVLAEADYEKKTGSNITMYGGNIVGNETTDDGAGGGVMVEEYSKFTMHGGNIIGNIGSVGGGVSVYEKGIFMMHGGNITDNTATYYGGGIENTGTLNLTAATNKNVTITGNKTTNDGVGGGGIFSTAGELHLSGKVIIKDNVSTTEVGLNNLATFSEIQIDDSLAGSDISVALACIDDEVGVAHASGVLTNGYKIQNEGAKLDDFFHYDGPNTCYMDWNDEKTELEVKEVPDEYSAISIPSIPNGKVTTDKWIAQGNNIVTLTVTPAKGYRLKEDTLKVNNGAVTVNKTNDTTYTFTMPNGAVAITAEFEEFVEPSNLSKLASVMAGEGQGTVDGLFEVKDNDLEGVREIKLLSNITFEDGDERLLIPSGKNIVLDLNGHTLDRGLSESTEAVEKGNVITVAAGGKLTIKDSNDSKEGKISGGNSAYGAAIISNGETVLENGSITDCKALSEDYDSENSKFGRGGAIYVPKNGKFTMTGGEIKGCSASVAGGAIFNVGTTNITGGKIDGCKVSGLDDNGTAKAKGGAVYNYGYSNFTMIGGEISGNMLGKVADMRGAGVYAAANADITLGGTAKITGNTDGEQKASNLFLYTDETFAISTDKAPASGMSVGVTTQKAPVNGAPVKISGNINADCSSFFTADNSNYEVKFNGNDIADYLEMVIKVPEPPQTGEGYTIDYAAEKATITDGYEISTKNGTGSGNTFEDGKLNPDASRNVAVEPDTKYYVRKASVSGGAPASAATEFTTAARQAAPESAPELDSKTDTTITVKAVTGQEYSIDGGDTWVSNAENSKITFSGLEAGKTYNIITRVKAVTTSGSEKFAGENSAASVITTNSSQQGTAAADPVDVVNGEIISGGEKVEIKGEDGKEVASKDIAAVAEAINDVLNNANVKEFDDTGIEAVTEASNKEIADALKAKADDPVAKENIKEEDISKYLNIKLVSADVNIDTTDGTTVTVNKIVFDVTPMATITVKDSNGQQVTLTTEITNDQINGKVTFLLPVDEDNKAETAAVYHKDEFLGNYPIKDDNYIEVTTGSFSEFGYITLDEHTAGAKISNTLYASLSDAVKTVKNGETITLLKDAAGTITVSRDVKFTIDDNGKANRANITAGKGYKLSRSGNAYTIKLTKAAGPEKASVLMLKGATSGSKAVKLSWTKVAGATKYVVYGNKCGKSMKKLKTTSGTKFTVKKIKGKKLKAHKEYKFKVVAYNGNRKLTACNAIHFITAKTKGKYANAKSISVKPLSAARAPGETVILKVKTKIYKNKEHINGHHGIDTKYTSDCPSVATVNRDGQVKAVAPGTATIYIQDIGGPWCKTTITVK